MSTVLKCVRWMGVSAAIFGASIAFAQSGKSGKVASPIDYNPFIRAGYYEGVFPNYNLPAQIFINYYYDKKGKPIYFGTILAQSDTGQYFGALYRITVLENGLLSWVQMFQNENGQMTYAPRSQATYDVKMVFDGSLRMLQFTITDFGRQLGCVDAITNAEYETGLGSSHFVNMPSAHFKTEDDNKDVSIFYNNRTMTGSVRLGDKVISGDFQLHERYMKPMAELRQASSDPETANGLRQKRELMGMVVATKPRNVFAEDYELWLISLPLISSIPTTTSTANNLCVAPAALIEED